MSLQQPRTLLEQLVGAEQRTWSELTEQFLRHARELHRESGEQTASLSWEHLQRIAAGKVAHPHPCTARVLQRQFGRPIGELLGPPEPPEPRQRDTQGITREDTAALAESRSMEEPSKLYQLASMDRSRQMMDRTMANGTITHAQVDNIERMVNLHARNCVIMPPLEMLGKLTADFDEIQALSSRIQPPRIHTRLYAAAAQIGALISDELMVLGDTHRAWAWHNTAIIAAVETGSRELQSRVRSLGILIPLYYGDAAEALKIAEEVCVLDPASDRCSPAVVLAITLKALALAQLGSIDASRAALDASAESLARLDRLDQIDSVFGFSDRRWYFYRARTVAELGDLERAWAAQDQALALYPDDVVGDPTIIKLDRALCLIRGNEIDEGCRLAADTLLRLPSEHRATIFLRYGRKLLSAIPKKYSTHHEFSQYRDVMTEISKAIEA